MRAAGLLADVLSQDWLIEASAHRAMCASLAAMLESVGPSAMKPKGHCNADAGEGDGADDDYADPAGHVEPDPAEIATPLPPSQDVTSHDGELLYRRVGSVAVVALEGPLTREPSWLDKYLGWTSYPTFIRRLQRATEDRVARSTLISIHSPGGSAFGCEAAVQAVREAASVKRTVAIANELAASGSHLLGAQTSAYFATPAAKVGCAGAVVTVTDSSRLYEQIGLKQHVIAAFGAPYKGLGQDGAEISKDHLDELQREIDQTGVWYLNHLAEGRGIEPDAAMGMMDGRIEMGPAAVEAGFVDDVIGFDDLLRQLLEL